MPASGYFRRRVFETSIDIRATPDDVWAVLVDVERWPVWTASMSEVKRLGEGTLAVGTRVRIKQPRLPATVWEVTSLEARRAFTWKATAPGVVSVADHRLAPASDGSVTVTLALRRTGPLAALVDLVFRRVTREYVTMEAEGLRRRCEAPT